MNPHLEFLLSSVYDGALALEHLADLRRSTLTDETIAAQFIRSVPPHMIPYLLGFDPPGVLSAYLLPFRSPARGFMDLVRMKIFPALTDKTGHSIKYLQPKGSAPRLYFVVSCLGEVLDSDRPLWIVEGEKKALAVAQLGVPTIGICGVHGWHRKGTFRLLDDFDEIPLLHREVNILPDSDYRMNAHVKHAIRTFGTQLAERKAVPLVRHLPSEVRP